MTLTNIASDYWTFFECFGFVPMEQVI